MKRTRRESVVAVCAAAQEPGGPEHGLALWPAARALASFVAAHPAHFAGAHTAVVELGAGPGLPGITAAAVHGCRVLLTDVGGAVLAQCRANVARNGVAHLCTVAPLDWRVPGSVAAAGAGAGADVVLASDCVYDDNKDVHEDLLAVVHELLVRREAAGAPAGGRARAFGAYCERNSDRSIAHLLRLWGLSARFVACVDVGGNEDDDDDDVQSIHIIEITLARDETT